MQEMKITAEKVEFNRKQLYFLIRNYENDMYNDPLTTYQLHPSENIIAMLQSHRQRRDANSPYETPIVQSCCAIVYFAFWNSFGFLIFYLSKVQIMNVPLLFSTVEYVCSNYNYLCYIAL